jgi:hypothetical protein
VPTTPGEGHSPELLVDVVENVDFGVDVVERLGGEAQGHAVIPQHLQDLQQRWTSNQQRAHKTHRQIKFIHTALVRSHNHSAPTTSPLLKAATSKTHYMSASPQMHNTHAHALCLPRKPLHGRQES